MSNNEDRNLQYEGPITGFKYEDGKIISNLENDDEILSSIGLFIVLFNIIDVELEHEFSEKVQEYRGSIHDFLCMQTTNQKIELLEESLSKEIILKLRKLNTFRNQLSHGSYGKNERGEIINFQLKKRLNKDVKIFAKHISKEILNKYIELEKEIICSFVEKDKTLHY